ncbi:MAG: hypothetical protein U0230_05120 [Polyangiales bacterium]
MRVEADESRGLVMKAHDDRGDTDASSYACGSGPCSVSVNLREDGRLVARFETEPLDGDEGSVVVLLLVIAGTEDGNYADEVDRWTGSLADYRSGAAPAWTLLAGNRDPIVLEPIPTVSCPDARECSRLASRLWQARNHRWALAYALSARSFDPTSASTLYTIASVYASAGDAAHAAEYLESLRTLGTRDATRALDRAKRDHDFDGVRVDPSVAAALAADPP